MDAISQKKRMYCEWQAIYLCAMMNHYMATLIDIPWGLQIICSLRTPLCFLLRAFNLAIRLQVLLITLLQNSFVLALAPSWVSF